MLVTQSFYLCLASLAFQHLERPWMVQEVDGEPPYGRSACQVLPIAGPIWQECQQVWLDNMDEHYSDRMTDHQSTIFIHH